MIHILVLCKKWLMVTLTMSALLISHLHSLQRSRKLGASPIAYGGVLNDVTKLPGNDSQVQEAASFAVDYAQIRHPSTILTTVQGRVVPYNITAARLLKLVFTADESNPYVYEAFHPATGYYFQPLVWGYTISFRISWDDHPHPWIHTFVISQHQGHFYIFQHTFRKGVSIILPPGIILPDVSRIIDDNVKPLNAMFESSLASCERNSYFDWWKGDSQDVCDQQEMAQHDCSLKSDGRDSSVNGELVKEKEKDSIEETCSSEPRNLTILCFNIWNTNTVVKRSGEYSKRLERMGQVLRSSSADVVGLQEVRFQEGCCDREGPNQMEQLAAWLPNYQYVYRPAQIQQSELPRRTEEGVAFLSQHPVTKIRHVLLSRNRSDVADGHQRVLLHAEINVPCFGSIHVLTTHLSLSHIARAHSVVEIWNYIKKLHGPVFLMGDFNAEKHNDEVKFLQGFMDIRGVSTRGLHDTWYSLHSREDGFTFNTLEEQLTKRIDFIFMRKDPQVTLTDAYLVDDGGRGAEAASDHLGIVAKFTLKEIKEQHDQDR